MSDLQALKKRKAAETAGGSSIGGHDEIIGDFVGLVVAKLLVREFEPQYVFSTHRTWENGAWKGKDGDPVPAVAIGTPEGELSGVFEIETKRTLDDPETTERWRRLAANTYLDLVVPERLLAEAKGLSGNH